jgi:hypothetical protein
MKAHRKRNGASTRNVTPVKSAVRGLNADLIAQVARLYLSPGMVVADVTYGQGQFWRKVDTGALDFRPSDLSTGTDFRHLPYDDDTIDTLVLDPPYLSGPTSGSALKGYNTGYKINESFIHLGVTSNEDVIELYRQGMIEAHRVVKPKGQVWVKCQDTISGGKQRWNHITIYEAARSSGGTARTFSSSFPEHMATGIASLGSYP